eukprot:Nk52_evm2s2635 gene=Nk52_evmTU2s2635
MGNTDEAEESGNAKPKEVYTLTGKEFNDLRKRRRTNITEEQVAHLEKVFSTEPWPTAGHKEDLATKLDMPLHTIQIWFQNRRARERSKQNKVTNKTNGRKNDSSNIAFVVKNINKRRKERHNVRMQMDEFRRIMNVVAYEEGFLEQQDHNALVDSTYGIDVSEERFLFYDRSQGLRMVKIADQTQGKS